MQRLATMLSESTLGYALQQLAPAERRRLLLIVLILGALAAILGVLSIPDSVVEAAPGTTLRAILVNSLPLLTQAL